MSIWSRISNAFRSDRLDREIQEELASHLAESAERGREPAEAARAFGSQLHAAEQVRDIKIAAWLDSVRADVVFGWRQLLKHRTASAAAILSLALAVGSCTSAFRLIDALLLRPLPVASPESLFFLTYETQDRSSGIKDASDGFDYPMFRLLRGAVKDQAHAMATAITAGSKSTTEAKSSGPIASMSPAGRFRPLA